jgi:hypothetical protein
LQLKKGDRVKHSSWGLGQVLENPSGDSIRVFFISVGEKKLSLQGAKLVQAQGADAEHPLLANLAKNAGLVALPYRSLPESIDFFKKKYDGGFYGEVFQKDERDYKVKAHDLIKALLSDEIFKELLEVGKYDEICKRSLKCLSSTNLVFPNEKMSLTDGLRDPKKHERFAKSLYNLLFGKETMEPRFEAFASVLYDIQAGKWTVATYFPFLQFPDKFMFLKPGVTQDAAKLCAFEIMYKPELNWQTYDRVLTFAKYLFDELRELKPRDMIDVQSFLWCISPE